MGGLSFVHSRGILHRDLKPANVLLNGNRLQLADFGIAAVLRNGRNNFAGTSQYIAPEMLAGLPYDERADSYSFGVVFYNILSCDTLMMDSTPCHARPTPTEGPAWARAVWLATLRITPQSRMPPASLLRELVPVPHGFAPAESLCTGGPGNPLWVA